MATLPAAAGLPLPSERLIKKRLHSEMEIVRSLVRKAETLVARDCQRVQCGAAAAAAAHSKSRPLPRRGKSERFSPRPETRPEATMTICAADSKRRRTSVTGMLNDEGTVVKVHQSPVSKQEEEEEIDICGGVSPVAVDMVPLSPIGEQEDEELIDICGGVSPVAVEKVHLSPPPVGKKDEAEPIDICGDCSPVAVGKFPQACTSSSSESSSSSSGSSSSGSDSSSSSSGSGSSGSDSDSDDDDDSATSTPAAASHLPTEVVETPLEHEVTVLTGQDEQDHHEMPTEREASLSPATEMRELIARALEEKKLRREADRKRAREEMEEMERTTRPIFGVLDRNDMRLLGITAVEHIVSPVKSRDSLRRRGGLLQQLGFFRKAEC